MKMYTEEQVREAFQEGKRRAAWLKGAEIFRPLSEDEFINKLNQE